MDCLFKPWLLLVLVGWVSGLAWAKTTQQALRQAPVLRGVQQPPPFFDTHLFAHKHHYSENWPLIRSSHAPNRPAQLVRVKVANLQTRTLIVLSFDVLPTYKTFRMIPPDRIVVDLERVQLATHLAGIGRSSAVKIRYSHPRPQVLRLILDLDPILATCDYRIVARGNQLYLVLSLQSLTITDLISLTNPLTPHSGSALVASKTGLVVGRAHARLSKSGIDRGTDTYDSQKVSKKIYSEKTFCARSKTCQAAIRRQPDHAKRLAVGGSTQPFLRYRRARPVIIVIDPGHGGQDPGTIGYLGVREKDVVLAISKRLQQILNQKPGFLVLLTRKNDSFISLRGRLTLARSLHADAFLAIHADAFKHAKAQGVSVFVLSARGASSEAARWLMERENYSELGGIDLGQEKNTLRSILIDLAQTATIASSLRLGKSLIHQLSKLGKLHHNLVEQAPFVVLKSPDIPSLLVEVGFLSNPLEERRINDPIYQQKLAVALAAGIEDYFRI